MEAQDIQKQDKIPKYAIEQMYQGSPSYKLINYRNGNKNIKLMLQTKSLFSVQLPRMPKEYILKILNDERHQNLIMVNSTNEIIGAVCFRLFIQGQFAEIVFFATAAGYQRKGFGNKLMCVMKSLMQNIRVKFILTYADNSAHGFFLRQGFSKTITLSRQKWEGFIQGYEGGTKMQYTTSTKIDYLNAEQFIKNQKELIQSEIKRICLNKVHLQRSLQFQKRSNHFFQKREKESFSAAVKKLPGMLEYSQGKQLELNWDNEIIDVFEQCEDFLYEVLNHPAAKILQNLSFKRSQIAQEDKSKSVELTDLFEKLDKKMYKSLDEFIEDLNCLLSYAKKSTSFDGFKLPFSELQEIIERKIENLTQIQSNLLKQKVLRQEVSQTASELV